MRVKVIQTKNLTRLAVAAESLTSRAPGTPGIGLIWGRSGFGKTTATAWLANKTGAIYLRAWPTWTPTSMLAAIMVELKMTPLARIAPMIRAIVNGLSAAGRAIFIDEADFLAEKPLLLDTLRSLHDVSSVPLILIGMQNFQRRIAHREQFVGRISQWVEFAGADLDDARLLARDLCEVKVSDDLVAALHKSSGGSMRALMIGLATMENYARKKRLEKVTAAEWANRGFTLSEPPRRPAFGVKALAA